MCNGSQQDEILAGVRNSTVFEVQTTKGEVHDSGVLLFNKHVLGKTFEVEDDVRRQTLALVSAEVTG